MYIPVYLIQHRSTYQCNIKARWFCSLIFSKLHKQCWHYILLYLASPFSLSSTHHPSFHCQLHSHCFPIITAPASQVNTQGALLLFTDHCSNHSIIIPAAFSSFPATHSLIIITWPSSFLFHSHNCSNTQPSSQLHFCCFPIISGDSLIITSPPSFLFHSHNCSNTHPSFILAAFPLFPATLSSSLHRHPTYCIPIIAPIVIPASFLLLYHHFGRRLSHHSLPFIISAAFPSLLQYPSQPHSPAAALPSFPATYVIS